MHYVRWQKSGDPRLNLTPPPRPVAYCAVDGCEGVTVGRGWCLAHYSRWRRGAAIGGPIVRYGSVAERFWAKVDRRGPGECWPWLGAVQSSGYGNFGLDGSRESARTVLAHRFAWELDHGPVPDALTIDHVRERGCTTRLCCNTAHMEPVPFSVNLERRSLERDGAGRFAS